MRAIRGKKKADGTLKYFLSHSDTVIVETTGGVKTTLTEFLKELDERIQQIASFVGFNE